MCDIVCEKPQGCGGKVNRTNIMQKQSSKGSLREVL